MVIGVTRSCGVGHSTSKWGEEGGHGGPPVHDGVGHTGWMRGYLQMDTGVGPSDGVVPSRLWRSGFRVVAHDVLCCGARPSLSMQIRQLEHVGTGVCTGQHPQALLPWRDMGTLMLRFGEAHESPLRIAVTPCRLEARYGRNWFKHTCHRESFLRCHGLPIANHQP